MQTAADHSAHVLTFMVAQEAMAYRDNLRVAYSDESDFGDQCYYCDRAADCLERLRDLGAHDVVFALTH